ncbi:MAG: hypothetical protein H6730_28965 [Deltaproteobacteria bacterium]|nr:hypothetical protein [Deltaproteobacteria bacterium]
MEEGKLKYAKGLAWRAVKADPATPRAHLVLGLLAQEEGKTDQAKASYKRFLKYEPTGDRAEEVKRILENLP